MAYDYPTNFTFNNQSFGVEGVGTLLGYGAYATGGFFGFGLLVLIFVLTLVITGFGNIRKSFPAASFITLIFSVYFARISLVSATLPFYFLAMTIVGFFIARAGEPSNY